ncbi:hypothetical protein [Streptomyces sp. MS2.AVA.5]|uniref:Uncharacterized protein n=1 Tax=Streptomyces achmelvichensis TaxID=3134111 RepID=A0ACC6PL89_9ACTN
MSQFSELTDEARLFQVAKGRRKVRRHVSRLIHRPAGGVSMSFVKDVVSGIGPGLIHSPSGFENLQVTGV